MTKGKVAIAAIYYGRVFMLTDFLRIGTSVLKATTFRNVNNIGDIADHD